MRTCSFTDDEIRQATDMYFESGMSQADVCKRLGSPSQTTLSRWTRSDPRYVAHRLEQAESVASGSATEERARRSYPYEVKLEAVRLAEEGHLTRRQTSERLGLFAPAMVSKRVTIAREQGRGALMPKGEPRERSADAAAPTPPPTV